MRNIKNTKIGAVTISKNLFNDSASLKWCNREIPKNNLDTGWVFLSELDTELFLSNKNNWAIISFEDMVEIEPAVLKVLNLKVGTELMFVSEDKSKYFINVSTGKKLD